MVRLFFVVLLCGLGSGCALQQEHKAFVIAFGSCNKQYEENVLWKDVLKNDPDVWVWDGDNIYSSDDGDMEQMKRDYEQQLQVKDYVTLTNSVTVMGTWDDHDYGWNDGGAEFAKKKESKELLLDFLKVPEDDERRSREGVYYARLFRTGQGSVKVIMLDTRYFRTALTKATDGKKRYQPNPYGEGTILGEAQWNWLKKELETSE
ncbi:MAG: alkaline phosphatase family protein, partial [Sinomicrobium sp.]|nr:alkaline phosphatase family protein [Sinomicrobium sp.]